MTEFRSGCLKKAIIFTNESGYLDQISSIKKAVFRSTKLISEALRGSALHYPTKKAYPSTRKLLKRLRER